MRLEIDIPKEFEGDYRGDKFKDFFSRVLCDIENGVMCGNYEKEVAEMFLKAFDESRLAYNVDVVVAELEKLEYFADKYTTSKTGIVLMAKDIVKAGVENAITTINNQA